MSSQPSPQEIMRPFFVPFSELNTNMSPTVTDLMKYVLFIQSYLNTKYTPRNPSNSEVLVIVSTKIENITALTSVVPPIFTHSTRWVL